MNLQRASPSDATVDRVTNPSLLADAHGVVLNRERVLAFSGFLKDGSREFGTWVRGRSMGNVLPNGSQVRVRIVPERDLAVGHVVAYVAEDRMVVHRLVRFTKSGDDQYLITRGDATVCCDRPVRASSVVGVVTEHCATGTWEPVRLPQGRGFAINWIASAISLGIGGLVGLSPRLADWMAIRLIRGHKLVMRLRGFVMCHVARKSPV
jgi:signal peptidase I